MKKLRVFAKSTIRNFFICMLIHASSIVKIIPAQANKSISRPNKYQLGLNVHYLGSDVLKSVNAILDFQKDITYLKPNHVFNTKIADQKKAVHNRFFISGRSFIPLSTRHHKKIILFCVEPGKPGSSGLKEVEIYDLT